MITTLSTYLTREFPLLKGQKLLIGASGGLDSTVLAYALKNLGYTIALAHCNFQLRGADADADENFVREFAKHLDATFYSTAFETEREAATQKISIQMAARKLRYDWFDQVSQLHNFDLIVTGHHADDNFETFLINVLRGTGLDGLSGISSRNQKLFRPLLQFTRQELEQFATEQKLAWREDQSNAEVNYLRNKLRHDVVPILKAIEPNLLSIFEATTKHLQDSRVIIDQAMEEVKQHVVDFDGVNMHIDLESLLRYQPIRPYLYELLKPYGFSAWNDIELLVDAQSGKQIYSKTHVLLKNRGTLCLSPLHKPSINSYELSLDKPLVTDDFTVQLTPTDDLTISTTANEVIMDADQLKFPLFLRRWREGDYFYPLGLNGKKKLSKYFKDKKYSLREKEEAWILSDAEKIIWIVGQRLDQRVAITTQTKSGLKITVHTY